MHWKKEINLTNGLELNGCQKERYEETIKEKNKETIKEANEEIIEEKNREKVVENIEKKNWN